MGRGQDRWVHEHGGDQLTTPMCDWCNMLFSRRTEAVFVALTGSIDEMELEEWWLCMTHADWLCRRRNSPRKVTLGNTIIIDVWELKPINETALKYYQSQLGRHN
jgi:hypothetical protein